MTRLIDADKLYPDCVTKKGTLAISQNQIANAPTVPQGEWIPVSERLPDKEGEYLLWGKIDESEEGEYTFIGNYDAGGEQFGIWHEQFDNRSLASYGSEFYEYSKVIAWQPLPKPYKEKDNDN